MKEFTTKSGKTIIVLEDVFPKSEDEIKNSTDFFLSNSGKQVFIAGKYVIYNSGLSSNLVYGDEEDILEYAMSL